MKHLFTFLLALLLIFAAMADEASILLQDHAGRVMFRNIRIRELK